MHAMTPLAKRTYTLLKTVPAGRVTTYKALADALGTRAYRAIGQFMKHNPYAPAVPCHRVVSSDGTIGGFNGGITKKIRMLRMEGIKISKNSIIDFPTLLFPFPAS
jgi:methylated-DNA-[protein]-cysteine S-methyltransferase